MKQAGIYIEGVAYSRTGNEYYFVEDLWGATVEINYQALSPGVAYTSALAEIGLSLALGNMAQPVWSHLATNHPTEALGYSGIAYVYDAVYRLNDSAQIENHNFEISTTTEFSSTIPDANMAVVVQQFLTDGQRGVQWPAAYLGDLTRYSDYVVSHGLFMSPALTDQAPAADTLMRWLKLTNSDVVMSGDVLKIVPLGDESKTGNGATYTANTTPVYDLGPDDLLNEGQPRVRVKPRSNEDVYNVVRVEYLNRSTGYNVDIAEARDRAHIDQFGERVMAVIKAHEITTAEVAGFAAQMELQRQLAVLNDYEFSLPWTKGRLEPLDLVTLTTGDELALVRMPVRIDSITEADDGQFDLVASDAPIGMASAPLFGVQQGDGYQPDYNANPGNVDTPVIFEAAEPTTGLEVCIAVRGLLPEWGGCKVWGSLDDVNYKYLGTVLGGSRYGTLSAGMTSTASSMAVAGLGAQQLTSVSAVDAAVLSTRCWVGGSSREFLAYETATFTGTGAYTLGGLVRGADGTAPAAHSAGAPFVRVDDRVVRSGALDPAYVGKTAYLKFTSFNGFGGGEQALADVTAYTYVITGEMLALQPPPGQSLQLSSTSFAFIFDSPTATTSSSPAIDLTAQPQGITGTIGWAATAYTGAGASLGAVTLSGSGNVRTLTPAAFVAPGDTRYVEVVATIGTLSETVTIYRGDNGGNALNLVFGNETVVVPTDSAGNNGVFTNASTQWVRVYEGVTDVTALWTFSRTDTACTSTLNGGTGPVSGTGTVNVAVSALTADFGTVLVTATRGSTTLEKLFRLTKGRAGAQGAPGPAGNQGISVGVVYALYTGNPTPGWNAGSTLTKTGSTLPSSTDSTPSSATAWTATVQNPAAGQAMFVSDYTFNPVTNQRVYGTPYLANLKVGTLSAITANLGTVTAGSLDTSGYVRAEGNTSVSVTDPNNTAPIPATTVALVGNLSAASQIGALGVANSAAANACGVYGYNLSTVFGGAGVRGYGHIGVLGRAANVAFSYGVGGYAAAQNGSIGVFGSATASGAVAISAFATNTGTTALQVTGASGFSGAATFSGSAAFNQNITATASSGIVLNVSPPASGTGIRIATAGSGSGLTIDASSGGTALYVLGPIRWDITTATGGGTAGTGFLATKPGASTNGEWLAMNVNGRAGRIAWWPDA